MVVRGKTLSVSMPARGFFDATGPVASTLAVPTTVVGKAALQPPIAYLPCRLDGNGDLAEVLMVELADGRVALVGYTALDRFVAACGDAHPWVLWQTSELERLRELKRFDVAYLDVPLPSQMRLESETGPDVDDRQTPSAPGGGPDLGEPR